MKELIIQEIGKPACDFISNHIEIQSSDSLIVSTSTTFNIENQHQASFQNIVNLKRVNDIRRINKFFEAVNLKMNLEGVFIGRALTYTQRNLHLSKKYPWGIRSIAIQGEFLFTRVFPKVLGLKKLFFITTRGKGRGLSQAETLGRLVSCGFDILEYKNIDGYLWYVVKKSKEPYYDLNPSYGPLFKMKRVGKNGKIIQVYKFRTMHPYAEYLQDYVLSVNGYSEIGKPADDFRLTPWGKFMRKYWLDELPQLINVFKGEMKLVGIRPLSKRFLAEYPDDIKQLRLKYKPGCVPPYVALLKQNVDDYIESERIYLADKEKNPHTTDIKYFFKALFNIFTNKIRSS